MDPVEFRYSEPFPGRNVCFRIGVRTAILVLPLLVVLVWLALRPETPPGSRYQIALFEFVFYCSAIVLLMFAASIVPFALGYVLRLRLEISGITWTSEYRVFTRFGRPPSVRFLPWWNVADMKILEFQSLPGVAALEERQERASRRKTPFRIRRRSAARQIRFRFIAITTKVPVEPRIAGPIYGDITPVNPVAGLPIEKLLGLMQTYWLSALSVP